mgnify:CR=1 FL=1
MRDSQMRVFFFWKGEFQLMNKIKRIMAKVGNCLGGFSGKIGNVVYYYCNGNLYARRRPYRKMLVRSKNQQLWQNRFSACISFYRSLNGVCLKPIWEKLGKLMSVNGLNAFIASNIQAFNGEMGISNYEEIHFSKGVLKVPMGFEIRERKGNKLKVCWDTGWQTSLDAGTDRLCAGVIYDDEPLRPLLAENVTGIRSEGIGMIELREGITKCYHLYCYFMSRDGRCYSGDKYFRG